MSSSNLSCLVVKRYVDNSMGNALCRAAKPEIKQAFKIKQDKLKSAQLLCKARACRYNIHKGWQTSEDIPIKQMEEHDKS